MAHPPGEPVEEVVALLEDWLERARSGELIQVIIGGVTPGGGVSTSWVGKAEHYMVVYAATILQTRIVTQAVALLDHS